MTRSFAAARFAILLAMIASPLAAAREKGYIDSRKYDPAQFPQLVEQLRAEMSPGGRFEEIAAAERAKVEEELGRMGELLAGAQSLEDLDETQRVALINAQERANAILTKRDGERLICQRRQLVGSHRTETYCETAQEKRDRTAFSREKKRQLELKSCGAEINCGPARTDFRPEPLTI